MGGGRLGQIGWMNAEVPEFGEASHSHSSMENPAFSGYISILRDANATCQEKIAAANNIIDTFSNSSSTISAELAKDAVRSCAEQLGSYGGAKGFTPLLSDPKYAELLGLCACAISTAFQKTTYRSSSENVHVGALSSDVQLKKEALSALSLPLDTSNYSKYLADMDLRATYSSLIYQPLAAIGAIYSSSSEGDLVDCKATKAVCSAALTPLTPEFLSNYPYYRQAYYNMLKSVISASGEHLFEHNEFISSAYFEIKKKALQIASSGQLADADINFFCNLLEAAKKSSSVASSETNEMFSAFLHGIIASPKDYNKDVWSDSFISFLEANKTSLAQGNFLSEIAAEYSSCQDEKRKVFLGACMLALASKQGGTASSYLQQTFGFGTDLLDAMSSCTPEWAGGMKGQFGNEPNRQWIDFLQMSLFEHDAKYAGKHPVAKVFPATNITQFSNYHPLLLGHIYDNLLGTSGEEVMFVVNTKHARGISFGSMNNPAFLGQFDYYASEPGTDSLLKEQLMRKVLAMMRLSPSEGESMPAFLKRTMGRFGIAYLQEMSDTDMFEAIVTKVPGARISLLAFDGHGTQDRILLKRGALGAKGGAFGKQGSGLAKQGDNYFDLLDEDLMRVIKLCMKPGGSIVLNACATAMGYDKGEENLAFAVAKATGADVIAATASHGGVVWAPRAGGKFNVDDIDFDNVNRDGGRKVVIGWRNGALTHVVGAPDVQTQPAAKSANLRGANIEQNHPNPFSGSTLIPFSAPLGSKVEIVIYNILGQRMHLHKEEQYSGGKSEFLLDAGALQNTLASGVYFAELLVDGVRVGQKKMLLEK